MLPASQKLYLSAHGVFSSWKYVLFALTLEGASFPAQLTSQPAIPATVLMSMLSTSMSAPRPLPGAIDPVGSFVLGDGDARRPSICLRLGPQEWAAMETVATAHGLSKQAAARQLVCVGLRSFGLAPG